MGGKFRARSPNVAPSSTHLGPKQVPWVKHLVPGPPGLNGRFVKAKGKPGHHLAGPKMARLKVLGRNLIGARGLFFWLLQHRGVWTHGETPVGPGKISFPAQGFFCPGLWGKTPPLGRAIFGNSRERGKPFVPQIFFPPGFFAENNGCKNPLETL